MCMVAEMLQKYFFIFNVFLKKLYIFIFNEKKCCILKKIYLYSIKIYLYLKTFISIPGFFILKYISLFNQKSTVFGSHVFHLLVKWRKVFACAVF